MCCGIDLSRGNDHRNFQPMAIYSLLSVENNAEDSLCFIKQFQKNLVIRLVGFYKDDVIQGLSNHLAQTSKGTKRLIKTFCVKFD